MTVKESLGDELMSLIAELYPICRSITGDGVRRTLSRLADVVPLEIHEVASGTAVLDWHVPDEWNIRDAWIKDRNGNKIVDFQNHNLHVVNYSIPVHRRVSRDELMKHLHSLPEHPDWIPYRTSYYERTWGFCLPHRQLEQMTDDDYEVCIDATLGQGSLTYGELYLPGEREDEIILSSHVCHPSLCDDNLSGIAVAIFLARELAEQPRRHSFRFLFAPGTIGAITWLARNRDQLSRVKHGLTLNCLGDKTPWTYKRTYQGDHAIDRAAEYVLDADERESGCIDFFPYGYDERQYNSPGFRLPFGSLMRGRHGQFPEYHSSADNLQFISAESLVESYQMVGAILRVLECDRVYRNLSPFGEPQLGRRGIYQSLGGGSTPDLQMAILWILNMSDGSRSLLDISQRSGIPFDRIVRAASILEQHELLESVG